MKFAVLVALVGFSQAVKLTQMPQSLVVQNAMESMLESIQTKDDNELQKLVDDAVKNAKVNETSLGKDKLVKEGELKAIEKTMSDRIYNRIIDQGYWRPALGSAYYRPQYPSYLGGYPLSAGLYGSIHSVLGLHDFINRYEMENQVVSHMVDPAMSEILGVMYDIVNKKPEEKKAEAALSQSSSVNLAVASAKVEAHAKMQGISEEALQKMVDAAIANKKNAPKEDGSIKKDGEMRAVEDILANTLYERIISDGYYRPTW